ncbi:hypothetical protein P4O66_010183 [Electrophorus voltai]|uniref:Reverse transcriptase domain-containing protein n=1 Tax=Electrophorus voltai TaxID=2609070 RepID=A0AAD8ZB76_9TELE|nr:hypothetical protein P4O66_010183 [Electrophorus voltai]
MWSGFPFTFPPSHPVTLGLPWLRAHNPQLHWSDNHVLEWAAPCKTWCLSHWTLPLQSTSVENPEVGEGLGAPQSIEIWRRCLAMQLPPHREWDCTITLKSAAIPLRCRVYPLSQEEDWIMAQYIRGTATRVWEFLARSVVAYIDDILIYSPSQDHVHDVRAVLGTLLQNHLYCKLEK